MLTPAQKELRRDKIGASEAAAILDLYRPEGAPRMDLFKTALDVFVEKVTGEETEPPPDDFQVWGLDVEPAIISNVAREGGYDLLEPPDGGRAWPSFVHPKLPLVTTPDALARAATAELLAIQAKNDQGWKKDLLWGPPGTDEVPGVFFVQATVELGVLRANELEVVRNEIAVSRHGGVPVTYPVGLDEDLFGRIADYLAAFVRDYLKPGRAPPGPIGSEAEYVRRRFPRERKGVEIAPTPELRELARKVKGLKAEKRALEAEILLRETDLKKKIGDAEGISGVCSWRWQRSAGTRRAGRVLRFVDEKEE